MAIDERGKTQRTRSKDAPEAQRKSSKDQDHKAPVFGRQQTQNSRIDDDLKSLGLRLRTLKKIEIAERFLSKEDNTH